MAEKTPTNPDEEPISLEGPEEPSAAGGRDEPISLVAEGQTAGLGGGGLRAFGVGGAGPQQAKEYRRKPNVNGAGAVRCRIFHSKIALASLEHLEAQINDWLDGEKIEIKQVGHLIGTMEGKRPEPNLLLIVWY